MSQRDRFPFLKGLLAAPPTPMHLDGSLNLDIIDAQARQLVELHVDGVFVGGTTGEHMNMTVEERKQVNQRWKEATQRLNQGVDPEKQIKLVLQIGATSLLDTIELARHAASLQPDAFSALPPYYHKPATVKALVASMKQVAEAAPNLPFYYYHIPMMTYVNLNMVDFLKQGSQVIPNLVGMKFSDGDVVQFSQCKELGFNMITGKDAMLYYFLSAGADGAIGCNYNYKFAVPLFQQMIAAVNRNDHKVAFELQQRALFFTLLISKYGGISAIKAISKLDGLDVGQPRLPLEAVTEEQYRQLESSLKENMFLP